MGQMVQTVSRYASALCVPLYTVRLLQIDRDEIPEVSGRVIRAAHDFHTLEAPRAAAAVAHRNPKINTRKKQWICCLSDPGISRDYQREYFMQTKKLE